MLGDVATALWEAGMRSVRILALVSVLSACGRYRPPLPPEMLAPAAVEGLVITPAETGVAFAWTASEKDRRGKELKSANGYSIERKEILNRGDETDPKVKFTQVGFVEDKHIAIRDQLREKARAEGKIGRNVKSPPEYTRFTFEDTTAQRGKTYIYQIVPQNQNGVEGQVGQLAKVVFQGPQSAVVMVASKELEDLAAVREMAPQ